MYLFVVVLQTNYEQAAKKGGNPSLPYHTFLVSNTDQGRPSAAMDLPQQPHYTLIVF